METLTKKLNPHERAVLEILRDAEGPLPEQFIMTEFRRRLKLGDSRTAGLLDLLRSTLGNLRGILAVHRETGEARHSTHKHTRECCPPSKEEAEALAKVTHYECLFYRISEIGKQILVA